VSDDAMLKILTDRMKAGVDVRVIGKVESKWNVPVEKYPGKRLHIRAIIRDGKRAFMGSQSLRRLELEKRREVGVIINDDSVVRQMQQIFEEDWAQTDSGRKKLKKEKKADKREEKVLAAAS
jgi:phosphatidylserine/phosphatidylglycerophosphate/cardiolipin synthase-like enzyme